MNRRCLPAALSLAGLPRIALAQPRMSRVGWVVTGTSAAAAPFLDPLRDELTRLGYVEGKNLILATRFGDDDPKRVPGLPPAVLARADRVVE